MSVAKSALKCLVLVSAVIGLLLGAGCGGEKEKEQMAVFLLDFQKTLDEYADVVSKADSVKMSEIEVKLDTFKAQAIQIKDEIGDKITPQAMEKFEQKVETLSKKYAALSGKSQ